MILGEVLMPLLCVVSWDILLKVRIFTQYCAQLKNFQDLIYTPTDAVAFSSAHFGRGVGPIYLDDVDCTGSESNLADCPHSPSVSCNPGHTEDAGVRCQGSFTQCYNLYVSTIDCRSQQLTAQSDTSLRGICNCS